MRSPSCLCVCVCVSPILTFINPSYQSVSLYVYPPIVARQRLGKNSHIVARQRLS
jgi:hypothetical protein